MSMRSRLTKSFWRTAAVHPFMMEVISNKEYLLTFFVYNCLIVKFHLYSSLYIFYNFRISRPGVISFKKSTSMKLLVIICITIYCIKIAEKVLICFGKRIIVIILWWVYNGQVVRVGIQAKGIIFEDSSFPLVEFFCFDAFCY